MVYLQVEKIAAIGLAASAKNLATFSLAANCLNLGGSQKPSRCKWQIPVVTQNRRAWNIDENANYIKQILYVKMGNLRTLGWSARFIPNGIGK